MRRPFTPEERAARQAAWDAHVERESARLRAAWEADDQSLTPEEHETRAAEAARQFGRRP